MNQTVKVDTEPGKTNSSIPLRPLEGSPIGKVNPYLLVVLWLIALAVALYFDARVANAVERFTPNGTSIGIISKFTWQAKVLRAFGTAWLTIVLCLLFLWLHPWRWRAVALLIASGAVGAFLYSIMKWTVGRLRPEYHEPYTVHLFTGGLKGYLYAERLSFPSGHTMLAFATAATLAVCIPRLRWLFYILAAGIVGTERVLEHSHYLSDVIAAMGVGVISCEIALWFLRRLIVPDASTNLAE